MSASSIPTFAPSAASASAKLTAVVDLPTPALAAGHRDNVLHAVYQFHAALHRMRDDLAGNGGSNLACVRQSGAQMVFNERLDFVPHAFRRITEQNLE